MADLKLYKVQYSTEVVVLAESPEDAELAVLQQSVDWTDELGQGEAFATKLTKETLPKEWAKSLPWTEHDVPEKTCEQILDET
jgi:hypothetical protein